MPSWPPTSMLSLGPCDPTHHPLFSLQTPGHRCPDTCVQVTALPGHQDRPKAAPGQHRPQPALHPPLLDPLPEERASALAATVQSPPVLVTAPLSPGHSWPVPPLPSLAGKCHHQPAPHCGPASLWPQPGTPCALPGPGPQPQRSPRGPEFPDVRGEVTVVGMAPAFWRPGHCHMGDDPLTAA